MVISNDESRRAIAAELIRLGCRRADLEHPGYIRVINDDGGVFHLGTANGPWQADIFVKGADESAQPAYTITVDSELHGASAEGIARYIVGKLNHRYDLLAYPTAKDQRHADQMERRERSR